MFNKKYLCASIALYALTGCFSTSENAERTQPSGGVVPAAETFFYELPSSLASENPSESLSTTPQSLGRSLGRSLVQSEIPAETGSIFDAYRPVPVYLHLANEAKNKVKEIVKELESKNIPEALDVTENGTHILSRTIDTTILGKEQKLFFIEMETEAGLPILKMNYWKNARGQYRGNFYYHERNEESDFFGGAIHFHYNGHNQEQFGRRMLVTFFKNEEMLENPGDPSIVRVWARKKDDRIFVKGGSYHPHFQDAFWTEGPKVYAFQGVTNTELNRSVLRVSFADANADFSNLWVDYALDKMVLKTVVENWKKELELNEEMRKVVAWGLVNEQDMGQMFASIARGDYAEEDIDPTTITTEEFLKFIALNREFILADHAEKGKSEFAELLRFLEMKQPIYLVDGAVIVGSALDEGSFGIFAKELTDADSDDLDYVELEGLDPEVELEMAEE